MTDSTGPSKAAMEAAIQVADEYWQDYTKGRPDTLGPADLAYRYIAPLLDSFARRARLPAAEEVWNEAGDFEQWYADYPDTTEYMDGMRDAFMAGARRARLEALEQAATECERHARFCKGEAEKGVHFDYLIARHNEAYYNAERIRALAQLEKEKG